MPLLVNPGRPLTQCLCLQSRFGTVKLAVVRHRMTEEGENTSWAIVTMEYPAGVDAALADQVGFSLFFCDFQ